MKLRYSALFFPAFLAGVSPVFAQSFGSETSDAVPAAGTSFLPDVRTPSLAAPQPRKTPGTGNASASQNRNASSQSDIFIPQGAMSVLDRPTKDGSKRGTVAINEIDEYGRPRPSNKIFLYYDNFKISRSISGMTSCDVRFFVNNNLDSRITNLDIKLVWPNLTTAVSFADVPPNSPTYYNYTLLGNGCYDLDKMPNIVVNRCRVKGMSSAQCAGTITWLKSVQ